MENLPWKWNRYGKGNGGNLIRIEDAAGNVIISGYCKNAEHANAIVAAVNNTPAAVSANTEALLAECKRVAHNAIHDAIYKIDDCEPVKDAVRDALDSIDLAAYAAPVHDREADRQRFPDPTFNRWLDESVSDCYTVWDAVGDIAAAWAGWDNRQFYALQPAQTAPTEMRRCQECSAPRKDEICHKCGGETFVPSEKWIEPALPPVDRIRELAREVGYAIGEHGTKERDLDLIAAPWTEDSVGNHALMQHIAKGLGAVIIEIERKPVGRYACTLQMDGYYKPIDLSVCPQSDVPTKLTEEEFIAAYAARSGTTGEALKKHFVALPCACGADICEGWAMVPNKPEHIQMHNMRYRPAAVPQTWKVLPSPAGAPPLDDDLRFILGRPCFTLIGMANVLRQMGYEIANRAEDEQAVSIHWMLDLYMKHGKAWREEASQILDLAKEAAKGGLVSLYRNRSHHTETKTKDSHHE